MSTLPCKKPLTMAAGALLTASVSNLFAADFQNNPFSMRDLPSGYMLAEKAIEGKCGKGKCGGKGMLKKMDKDGNGKISRKEFMQAHRKMFLKMDKNEDGMLDRSEIKKMKENKMRKWGKTAEGKCGGGKCGEGKCGGKK